MLSIVGARLAGLARRNSTSPERDMNGRRGVTVWSERSDLIHRISTLFPRFGLADTPGASHPRDGASGCRLGAGAWSLSVSGFHGVLHAIYLEGADQCQPMPLQPPTRQAPPRATRQHPWSSVLRTSRCHETDPINRGRQDRCVGRRRGHGSRGCEKSGLVVEQNYGKNAPLVADMFRIQIAAATCFGLAVIMLAIRAIGD